ncbi:FIST signal transduction protein [Thiohalorhabdus sp. Cl-TMA]|uniref:FIST signal transduction protein n=1 Tax=Thiohalorhabdus methylotrophus TaxID=3242694 RepID=A0ABV4TQR3_9GAMM
MQVQQAVIPGKIPAFKFGRQSMLQDALSDAHLVMVFGPLKKMQSSGLPRLLREHYPDAEVIGCSTSGEISSAEGVTEDPVTVTAVHWSRTHMRVEEARARDMGLSFNAGWQLGERLAGPDLAAVLLLADGLAVNGSDLLVGLQQVLPPEVPVLGGLAGDNAAFTHTVVLHNDRVQSGYAVAVGLYGRGLRVGSGSLSGWEPFGALHTVTRSLRNTVYEIDGRPALEVYKEYLGTEAGRLPGSGLSYPVAVMDGEGAGEEAEIQLVRTLLGVDEKEQSLVFAGNIKQDARIRICRSTEHQLIQSAGESGRSALGEAGSGSGLALLVSCVGRKLVLGRRVADEVEAVSRAFGPEAVLTGFYSNGEMCPGRREPRSLLHNQTMTVAHLEEVDDP